MSYKRIFLWNKRFQLDAFTRKFPKDKLRNLLSRRAKRKEKRFYDNEIERGIDAYNERYDENDFNKEKIYY